MDEAESWDLPLDGYEYDPNALDLSLEGVGAGMGLPSAHFDGHESFGGFSELQLGTLEQGGFDSGWDLPHPDLPSSNTEHVPVHLHEIEPETSHTCQVCYGYSCVCGNPLRVRCPIPSLSVHSSPH